jgi:hypothetical protein
MQQRELVNLIESKMNLNEIHNLCFDMGIDYESIGGANTKEGKSRELVARCKRYAMLPELLDAIARNRKDITFSSSDLADAEATVGEPEAAEDSQWIHGAAAQQQNKEAQRTAALALLDADIIPAGMKAALRFLVENA